MESSGAQGGNPYRGLTGTTIAGLTVLELIGTGGMGAVFRARQQGLEIDRAIKVIRAEARHTRGVAERLRREGVVLSRLNHHNVIKVLDAGQLENSWIFLVMEYIEGTDLADLVLREGPQSVEATLIILRQLAAALRYAHGEQVIHRDLKPQNLILRGGDREQLTVLDFGLAKVLGDELITELTGESEVVGTPLYMAPEQAKAGEVSYPADIYAAAGIAYYLLSGDPVFSPAKFATPLHMLLAHCNEAPEPIGLRLSGARVPGELDSLLLECLDKDPSARPTATEFAERVGALLDDVRSAVRARGKRLTDIPPDADAETFKSFPVIDEEEMPASLVVARREHPNPTAEALATQISAVARDIADLLTSASDDPALRESVAALNGHHRALEELGVDLALANSDAGAPPKESDQLSHRAALVESELRRTQKELVDEILGRRADVSSEHALRLYEELDELAARYREAAR